RYGMTETPSIVSGMTFHPPYDDDWSSSGRVLPVWELRIVDGAGRPLSDGEEGEIQLRGPGLAWPYYGESETEDAFFATGDLGVLSDGRLSISGRKSLFIKNGGYRISPEEVEAVLRRHDAVADVRVSMGRDGLTAEWVPRGDELPAQALREFAAERLPAYAVPKNLVKRAEIPRTASGKIRRGPDLPGAAHDPIPQERPTQALRKE
ncbi:MAG: fatty acid--CoA ligase family protein, partial [Acidobacteriota bacterium]